MVAAWKKQILFQKVLSVRQIWAKIPFTIIEKKKLKFGNLLDPSLKKRVPATIMILTGKAKEAVLKMEINELIEWC